MSISRSRIWRDAVLAEENVSADKLEAELRAGSNLVWFDLVRPDAEDLMRLTRGLSFDFHVVEDALAPGERPKAYWRDHRAFIQAYAARLAQVPGFESRLRSSRVSAMVVHNALITVRTDDEGFDIDELVARWDADPELIRLGSIGLAYALIDVLVDSQNEVIAQLDDDMEALEDLLFDNQPQTQYVSRQAYRLRRELVEIRRLVLPMRDVVNVIIRHGHEVGWDDDLHGYYDDLYDHVMRETEWTESLRDLVGSIFETNLSLSDMRLNVVMKKLSGWAAIIAVPTLITGWFGMNVPYWGFSQPWGVGLATGTVIITAVVLYILFKRYDWL